MSYSHCLFGQKDSYKMLKELVVIWSIMGRYKLILLDLFDWTHKYIVHWMLLYRNENSFAILASVVNVPSAISFSFCIKECSLGNFNNVSRVFILSSPSHHLSRPITTHAGTECPSLTFNPRMDSPLLLTICYIAINVEICGDTYYHNIHNIHSSQLYIPLHEYEHQNWMKRG